MTVVDSLLKGSIDLHVHHGPDAHRARSVDALDAARDAAAAGMRALVLKSHDYPTAPLAAIISRMVSGVTVVGSICLDVQIGGLNLEALAVSGALGARIVWLPTFSSANQMREQGQEGGLTVLDDKGKLLSVMYDIFELVKKYDMVLATGHLSKEEVFIVVDEARKKGVRKIVVTHPTPLHPGPKLETDQLIELAKKGAYIEHCFNGTMPGGHREDPAYIVDAVRRVGAEQTVLSTDFGQEHNPRPAEGFRVMLGTYLKYGLTERELEISAKTNPAKLLGLD
ncbi:MAG: DUF6282 family protein [Chloroflexota bacterium]